jgi:hypothetical protein
MTRFGFGKAEFARTAELMSDLILQGHNIQEDVKKLRKDFTVMHYCFDDEEITAALDRLQDVL